MKRTLFNLFFIFSLTISCKKEIQQEAVKPKPVEKIENTAPKKVEIVEPKAWDSINHNNAIDFLIAYGKLHKENKVRIKTRLGDMVVKLYDDTPLHRASFLFLANAGYFDTTCFHRVVPDFIVQGGNSESYKTMEQKNKYENYTIPPEFRKHRKHKYGALAAAREWENNISKKSNPFEFYFIQSKKGAHHIDGEHTVFGEVIEGFNVLDKIAKVKTGRDEWPLEDVYMEIEVL
ncbi:peptidylprolyl isomerase [Aureibaculum sp. 2210JD6-5]|uniref:peptidylprolyl isomerase n=1 Tax=Aureibaculum sp. 2210JD6-5 TaxID=3103957 RepID=UPI002AAED915|nr:peptidylprolyl isomerase [Aureibaculum sp. 2210JD6-5]MDY7394158.1 peptidylprolyl isomerase [Aureibaculum sp. 2210JD6-5]